MSIDALGPAAAKSADGKEIPDINTDSETYFLLTSLTSGSSAIITATSRLEVLLVTMKVPYVAVDIATNDKAKNLWKRRGNGKRLPVVVHDGVVIGNFEDLEQANEINSFKQTLRIPVKPDDADSITRKPSVASLDFTVSKKPSASPLPKIESEPEPAFVPTPMAHAVAKAAALAAEKRKSGAFTIASRASSIRSVRSVASTKKHVEGPTPKVEEPAPKVEEPAPKVEEPAPKVEDPAPKVEESAPKVEESAPKVEEPAPKVEEPVVEEPVAVVEKAPKVKETPRTVKATSSIRNRAPVPAAAKRSSAAPTAKTVAERAIKATGRASVDEKRNSISRSSSRASSLRPESRISVRPDSKSAKRTTLSGTQEKKAPSITARSVKSTSSSSTVKPTDRGLKSEKKSKIDKLKKEEGSKFCGMCTIS